MDTESKQDGAPDVAAYQSQSGGILDMLGGLEKKFKEELSDTEAAETSRVQNYDMNMIQLADLIDHSKADTEASLAADQKTLAEMTSTFEQHSGIFKENQEIRQLELEAIAKAIEIISSPNVSASYAGHINLAQTNFLQMTSSSRRALVKDRAAALLQKRATALKSATLLKLVAEMKANPFAKA